MIFQHFYRFIGFQREREREREREYLGNCEYKVYFVCALVPFSNHPIVTIF